MATINYKNHPQFGKDTIDYICKVLNLCDKSCGDYALHTYFNRFENDWTIMVLHYTDKYTAVSNLAIMVADYSSGSQKILLQEDIRDYKHMREVVKRAKELVGIVLTTPCIKKEEKERWKSKEGDSKFFVGYEDEDFPF